MNNLLTDVNPDILILDSHDDCSCLSPIEFHLNIQNYNINVSVIHFNARSLARNFEYIHIFWDTLSSKFSVIAISETWIRGIPIVPFHVDGYTVIHSDRVIGRGGGVCFISTVRTDLFDS